MKRTNFKIKNPELTSTEESGLVIEELLERCGLMKIQKEGIEKIVESFVRPTIDVKKRVEIFENLPGTKISKLVREYTERKVSLENLPLRLEKDLNISEKEAKQIAEGLEKKLLILIKPIGERKLPPSEIPLPEAEASTILSEKPKIPPKKDIYREPIG
ncbi:MAG: hypothetical protein ISS84_01425 [Candidatus Pacebacteria bacterium]|nr:hypothetical protein [Candidatus Paceibacterota bacterium]